jgi:hypothetical protein
MFAGGPAAGSFTVKSNGPVAVNSGFMDRSFGNKKSPLAPRAYRTVMMASSSSGEKKKVLVLGGDGFCGWPTSLHLSD